MRNHVVKWLIVVGATMAMVCATVDAANMVIGNFGSVSTDIMFFETGPDYSEGADAEETSNSIPPGSGLDIFSSPEGHPLGDLDTDMRPSNTPGIDVNLAYSGSGTVSGTNQLRIQIINNYGLENKHIVAYDIADPNTTYPVDPNFGATTIIDLPDLVDEPPGTYATWAVDIVPDVPGDITNSTGEVGSLDGVVDIYDLQALCSSWLTVTNNGEYYTSGEQDNYSIGDVNYNGKVDLEDYSVIGESWLE